MPNLSTKVDKTFVTRTRAAARRQGKTVSAFVREAVAERLEAEQPKTFGELYPDGLACFDGPGDLSTREGFPGKARHR